MFKNPTILILSFIMLVNALAYGTIIPLLYPYAARFGLNPLGLSLLFASFSLAQFLATPLLGRLSDRVGRKPVLLVCLFGTGASLVLFALAQSVAVLFIARIIDGITGGNISVAQAIIADSTKGEDRAKAFGMLGAAFGFGFLFGPAIGGLLGQFGLQAPFFFGAGLAIIGTFLGAIILKETLPNEIKNQKSAFNVPLFRFDAIFKALSSPTVGVVLGISFLSALAVNAFILGFQSYTNDVLKLGTTQIGLLFALSGLVSMLMQIIGLRFLLKWFSSKKKVILGSFVICAVVLLIMSQMTLLLPFAFVLFFFMLASAPQNPMITALLSERTKAEDQGGVLGINQSYVSMGQIIGPLVAGIVATRISIAAIFILAAGFYGIAALASRWLFIPVTEKADI